MTMRFRFTIRDLLWLTLVVAIVTGRLSSDHVIRREHGREFNSLRQALVEARARAIAWGNRKQDAAIIDRRHDWTNAKAALDRARGTFADGQLVGT